MADRTSGIMQCVGAWVFLLWMLCVIAGLSTLCVGGLRLFQDRRFQAGLKQAKSDIDAGRFEAAER